MTDEVRYALPLGFIGRIVHFFWVKRELKKIFDYRACVIAGMLEKTDAGGKTKSDPENKSEIIKS